MLKNLNLTNSLLNSVTTPGGGLTPGGHLRNTLRN